MYIPRRTLYHSTLRLATHPSCSVRLLTTTAKQPPSFSTKTRNFVLGTASIFATVLFLDYYFDSRAAIHKYLLMPVLRGVLDAEDAHRLAIWSAKWGLSASDRVKDDERLAVEVWGRKMANPVGLAAGFDKHGEAIDGLFDIGFGYVEIGSVTPKPQPGNPKPRVFRLPQDRALINRYGFPSDGHRTVALRLRERIRRYIYGTLSHHPKETARLLASSPDGFGTLVDAIGVNRSLYGSKLLGINLGKNKSSDVESVEDYVKGVKELGDYADVLVINVSSPNTPGLRSLQKREKLEKLLREVIRARNTLSKPQPPLLVKISPDLSDEELDDISDVAVATGVDGIIISNTTISRADTLFSGKYIHMRINMDELHFYLSAFSQN
ncbi:10527_t:CDS:2 [Paraglomus occultum]|uniref:Dihydroorotate dehydrogenase (quinone), mitochondrial n=1 Tax=Paraglomus occultum TaxID=144539 RepID=A0A9N8WPJ3_9GLOM|nr:10527_t:CDS:2 [Paraglomus occultum]